MDKKKAISTLPKRGLVAKSQMELAKKLERLSGQPIELNNFKFVYLSIDCSGSMSEENKINQAKNGLIGFASEALRKGYSVGLIKFASEAEHFLEPQREIAKLSAYLEHIGTGGSTNMTAALQMAINKLSTKSGEKVLCVVTDGMPDDKNAALRTANEAKLKGIDIMTIGTDDADGEFLASLATRRELSAKVTRQELEGSIVSMARLLPWDNS